MIKNKNNHPTVPIKVKLPEKLAAKVDSYAKDLGLSPEKLIVEIVDVYFVECVD